MIAASIGVITIVLHLVDIPATSLAGRSLVDGLHAPRFGIIAVVLVILFCTSHDRPAAYSRALLLSVVITGGAEALQYFRPRDADLIDLGWGIFGI